MKEVGYWWNSSDIQLVELSDGKVYALHGWNGEVYTECWICSGPYYHDASEERYTLRPIWKEIGEDDFEIVDYDVL